jgi:hypothetical protein
MFADDRIGEDSADSGCRIRPGPGKPQHSDHSGRSTLRRWTVHATSRLVAIAKLLIKERSPLRQFGALLWADLRAPLYSGKTPVSAMYDTFAINIFHTRTLEFYLGFIANLDTEGFSEINSSAAHKRRHASLKGIRW